jgi:endonuclease YncB( thermonuclease family)
LNVQKIKKYSFQMRHTRINPLFFKRVVRVFTLLSWISLPVLAQSAGKNSDDCPAGVNKEPCHTEKSRSTDLNPRQTLKGVITRVRDGDTFEVNGIPIRLAALDCPEKNTFEGQYATHIAKKYTGANAECELTGAKTYDRLVGYCKVDDTDFGKMMMMNSACKVWEKYDIWNRY